MAVATGGKGVAAALNSLTSPGMVAASLASLAQGARFVEIGKRDIWSQRRFAMVSAATFVPHCAVIYLCNQGSQQLFAMVSAFLVCLHDAQ